MTDLSNCTFLIPVRIESLDRYHNLRAVLGYLNHHFKTNVKLYEVYSNESRIDFLDDFINLKIDYQFEVLEDSQAFHRTRYLNKMLDSTETKIVSNYDADVLLPTNVYSDIVNYLIEENADFVYPYIFGEGQKKLNYSEWYDDKNKELLYWSMIKFLETYDLSYLDREDTFITNSLSSYGHCFFAKTKAYKSAYGENEEFISYGPEDVERASRFQKLGFKVDWWTNFVYHLEHSRTEDSSKNNPYFEKNNELFEYLSNLNIEDLRNYYIIRSKFF